MAHDVDERTIARELDQLACRIGADRLLRLTVQIAPERQQFRLLDDRDRVARAKRLAVIGQHVDHIVARPGNAQSFHRRRILACVQRDGFRQSRNRPGGGEAIRPLRPRRRIAPLVDALEAQSKRLAHAAHRRNNRLIAGGGTGDDGDPRLLRQLDVVVGCPRVDEHAELERGLVERLHPDAGRALPPVAEANDDPVAFTQEAAHHADEQRLVPGPDVALRVVLDIQHRAVARLDRRVIPALRVVELRAPHIAREAMDDLDRAGVVDAEVARGVRERQRLEASRFERALRVDRRVSHALGEIGRMRHQCTCP